MMRKITAVWLTVILMLSSVCALAEADVITVGKVGFGRDIVQRSADSLKLTYLAQGETIGEDERDAILDHVEEQFTGMGVIANVLEENGLYDFSADELTLIDTQAQEQYDELWNSAAQAVREAYGESITDAEITEYLEQLTITLDTVREELMISARQTRFVELYNPGVSVTDEEVLAYYDDNYVRPYRERYADNIPLFESEIMLEGEQTPYIPEGYRTIKNVLLAIPEDIAAELEAKGETRDQSEQAANEAYEALAAAAAANEDMTALRETYLAAKEAYEAVASEYETVWNSVIPAMRERIDAVYAAIESGELFEAVMDTYSIDRKYLNVTDAGYPFHPASTLWTQEIRDAVLSIKEVGGVSEPVMTAAGVSIIKYTGDYNENLTALSDAEIDELRPYALQDKIDTLAAEKVEELRDGYTVSFDRDSITFD